MGQFKFNEPLLSTIIAVAGQSDAGYGRQRIACRGRRERDLASGCEIERLAAAG